MSSHIFQAMLSNHVLKSLLTPNISWHYVVKIIPGLSRSVSCHLHALPYQTCTFFLFFKVWDFCKNFFSSLFLLFLLSSLPSFFSSFFLPVVSSSTVSFPSIAHPVTPVTPVTTITLVTPVIPSHPFNPTDPPKPLRLRSPNFFFIFKFQNQDSISRTFLEQCVLLVSSNFVYIIYINSSEKIPRFIHAVVNTEGLG